MLSLHTLAKWMAGIFENDRTYNLPEDIYNDAVPSGMHGYLHDDR